MDYQSHSSNVLVAQYCVPVRCMQDGKPTLVSFYCMYEYSCWYVFSSRESRLSSRAPQEQAWREDLGLATLYSRFQEICSVAPLMHHPPTDRRTRHCTMCTGACDVLRNSLRWRQMRAPGVVCVSWLLLALQHLSLTPSHLFLNMVGFRSCQHHNFTVVSRSLNVLHYRLYWLKFFSVKLLYSVANITM